MAARQRWEANFRARDSGLVARPIDDVAVATARSRVSPAALLCQQPAGCPNSPDITDIDGWVGGRLSVAITIIAVRSRNRNRSICKSANFELSRHTPEVRRRPADTGPGGVRFAGPADDALPPGGCSLLPLARSLRCGRRPRHFPRDGQLGIFRHAGTVWYIWTAAVCCVQVMPKSDVTMVLCPSSDGQLRQHPPPPCAAHARACHRAISSWMPRLTWTVVAGRDSALPKTRGGGPSQSRGPITLAA